MQTARDQGWGMSIGPIEPDAFRDFARRFGTSEEIGRIGTALDPERPAGEDPRGEIVLLGLFGCDALCAVACCVVTPGGDDTLVCKLDAVIVDTALRRRSLAKILVASTFSSLVTRSGGKLARVYAHSVHPATVRLLAGLCFRPPPPVGAPISAIQIEGGKGRRFAARCDEVSRGVAGRLKLQCTFCQGEDRRARPWCKPAA